MSSHELSPRTTDPPSPRLSPRTQMSATFDTFDGLGIKSDQENAAPAIHTDHDYDIHKGITSSPDRRVDASRTADSTTMLSPTSATFSFNSPKGSVYSPFNPQTGDLSDGASQSQEVGGNRNPFNFTPMQYSADSPSKADALGRRKGHRYRHSSIHASHMQSLVREPERRSVLSVPQSLPMPTRKEAWWSLTRNQTGRLTWCFCHFLVAAYVQFAGAGSLALTGLSRLLLFDAAGATVCVVVDVMGNFEVWKRSSIKHPFGLERADVLAGFGMAVFIGFMGLDIISHGIQHSLENLGTHESHTRHTHERVPAGSVDLASLLAIGSTLISAVLLKNHARIGRAMRFELIAGWGKILGNPSHFLTLSCSVLLLVLPFLSIRTYQHFDIILSFFIASLMIAFGVRLGTALASMLLMSYKPRPDDKLAIRDVIADIETDPGVSAVEEARFWQVHYGLCLANLKLKYRGAAYGDDMMKIRQRIMSMVRQRLGDGRKGASWEVSVQMALDRD